MTQESEELLALAEQTPRKELGPNTTFQTVIEVGGQERILTVTSEEVMATVANYFDYAGNFHQDRANAAEALTSAYNNPEITPETNADFVAYAAGVEASGAGHYNVAAGFMEFAYNSSFPAVNNDRVNVPLTEDPDGSIVSMPAKTYYAGETLNNLTLYMKTLTERSSGDKTPAIRWTLANQMKIAGLYDHLMARWKEMCLTVNEEEDEPNPDQVAYRDLLAHYAGLGVTLLTNQY